MVKRDLWEPWEKVFQNCRSSRETELVEKFPIQTTTAWLGNSLQVAAKHYLQLTDEHFERALKSDPKAAQNAAQYAHGSNRKTREHSADNPCFPEKYDPLRYYTHVEVAEAGLEPARACAQRILKHFDT